MSKETIIISLGGSIIVPEKIDIGFLKNFKELILKYLKTKKFFIVTGGGKTARIYQKAAAWIGPLIRDDSDWLGIYGTRINAHLIRTIFRRWAYMRIITNPVKMKKDIKEDIVVAAGWKPGWSTDYVAVRLAEKYKIKTILNMTNVSYVYDKDPEEYRDAKPLKEISWKNFRKIIGDKWDPGLSLPFDPVASKLAQKLKLKVIILKGTNLKNVDKFLRGKKFEGTIIK